MTRQARAEVQGLIASPSLPPYSCGRAAVVAEQAAEPLLSLNSLDRRSRSALLRLLMSCDRHIAQPPDATSPCCRRFTHQARRKKEDADQRRCLGRSRGGWTTKVHAAVSGAGRAVRLLLSPGQAGDAPRAEALLKGLRPRHVIADPRGRLRQRRDPPDHPAKQGQGLHPPQPDTQGEEAIRQATLQAPQRDRTLLRCYQTLPPCGHTLREEGRELLGLRLARRHHGGAQLNVHIT